MIVIHREANNNRETFEKIICELTQDLNNEKTFKSDYLSHRQGTKIEVDVYELIKKISVGTVFDGNIELISGQNFPDIVAYCSKEKAFGLEVKTTEKNKWTTTGSSIFENTRIEGLEQIYLLFGKLLTPVVFKSGLYQKCLYDVAITHSPRYLIDMETPPGKTIFDKIGVDYETLRRMKNPFKPIREYFRKGLKGKGEDVWWVDEKQEKTQSIAIKAWNNLNEELRDKLRNYAFVYFPDLLGNSSKKYVSISSWLVTRHGVVNHALRDTFSAGGTVKVADIVFPKIYGHFFKNLEDIKDIVRTQEIEDLTYYWEEHVREETKLNIWRKLCLKASKDKLSDKKQIEYLEKKLLIKGLD